jgi:hypothetical protein
MAATNQSLPEGAAHKLTVERSVTPSGERLATNVQNIYGLSSV